MGFDLDSSGQESSNPLAARSLEATFVGYLATSIIGRYRPWQSGRKPSPSGLS
jgi:hypothetical protein